MLEYFGEKAQPFCGKCSVCLGLSNTKATTHNSLKANTSLKAHSSLKANTSLKAHSSLKAKITPVSGLDLKIYEYLIEVRKRIADRLGLVQDKIFPTRIIRAFARVLPDTYLKMIFLCEASPLHVFLYGRYFREVIRTYRNFHGINSKIKGLRRKSSRQSP